MEKFDLFSILLGTLIKIVSGYLLLGAVCFIIIEGYNTTMRRRGRILQHRLQEVIGCTKLYDDIFNYPLIKIVGEYPSYINIDNLTMAVITSIKAREKEVKKEPGDSKRVLFAKMYGSDSEFIKALADIEAPDYELYKKKIKDIFWEQMNAISGLFGRKVQRQILVVAILLTVSLNIDTLHIFKSLNESSVIGNVMSVLRQPLSSGTDTAANFKELNINAKRALETIDRSFPIGWGKDEFSFLLQPGKENENGIITYGLLKTIGFTISIIMIGFSAIFSFHVLTRYVNVRDASAVNRNKDSDRPGE